MPEETAISKDFYDQTEKNSPTGPLKFSWREFWISLLYENLPPVFVSPLAAMIVEKSIVRGWHVSQHRFLFAISTKHNPLSSVLAYCLVIYPCSWIITAALLLKLFSEESLVANVDIFHILIPYLFLFMRRMIIAVKYGYFRPEEIERLSHPAPDWDLDQTNRRLVGQGWSDPERFPGLIESQLIDSIERNNLPLHNMGFAFESKVSKELKTRMNFDRFRSEANLRADEKISAAYLLHLILFSVYKNPLPRANQIFAIVCALGFSITPIIFRVSNGLPAFGGNYLEAIIILGSMLGFLGGALNFMIFVLIAAYDFERRYKTLDFLGRMIVSPGLAMGELGFDRANSYLCLDINDREHVFNWMNCRTVLRAFGEAYYLRIQGYTSILLAYSMFCVILLNLVAWGGLPHYSSSIASLLTIILVISSISIFSIGKAMKLQGLSAEQRDLIGKKLFFQEEDIWSRKNKDEGSQEIGEVQGANALLTQVYEMISFNEMVYKPTRVLGFQVNQAVIGSALGLILTGCLLALEGYAGSGIQYDASGWFGG